ncbi:hypothetical protein [Dysgonomonas macrotermitis]|uniref:MG2 domain-containing protein n=1 Tax=Dysgonomonas macrotermitis TaxID=1346286 RepID=A0A1M4WLD0_9BACT|nr:hypothetical protein [Dysgonomonas macrotermitis]SHE82005.1 hypothetical protein SAMN05444362_102254 [Dysgonomonas macrotermitis]
MKTQITLILSILFSSLIYGQTPQDSTTQKLYSFVKNINTFNHLYPQEKAYLHFDNTGYFLGETIWFKAYVVTASDLQPSDLSKVLYAEILTPEGQIMESKKLKLENGQAHADFMLKDSLYAGYYEVRAYTKSMLNFGEDVVFSRVFPVFDKPKQEGDYSTKTMTARSWKRIVNSVREPSPKYKALNMEFYPEGGNLIQGLSNKVAFRITGDQGEPVEATGVIQNSGGQEVTTFTTVHEGMGSFVLYPEAGIYTAVITYQGKEHKITLPVSQSEGYAMQVNNLDVENLTIQIDRTKTTESEPLGITFTCRGKAYVFDILEPTGNEPISLTIPKESLPTGVIQITLFNTSGRIFAERLAFVNHGITGYTTNTNIKTDYKPLSPVKIELELRDHQNHPIETTFSLSVRDSDSDIPTNYTGNLQTDLLLTSDLKGYINDPTYYFEEDDIRRKLSLDLLLMTQGWRRYDWQYMSGQKSFEVKYGIEKGLTIEGRVLSSVRKKEQEGIDVTMWILTPYQKGTCITDSQGRFNLLLDDFKGRQNLTLETRKKGKLQHSRILLDRLFIPESRYYSYQETILPVLSRSKEAAIINSTEPSLENTIDIEYASDITIKSHILKEAVVVEKKKKSLQETVLENAIEILDVQQKLDDVRDEADMETGDFLDFLDRYYPQQFRKSERDSTVTISYIYNNRPISTEFRLKGMKVPDIFSYVGMDNIERISISPLLFDEKGNNFVYVDIFPHDDMQRKKYKKGIRETTFQGYGNVSHFPSPDYSSVKLPDEKDFRRTLYWNPNVKTDMEGKASVDFYNNKVAKNIIIDIENIKGKEVVQ